MNSHPRSFPLLNRIAYYEKGVEVNEIDVQFYEGEYSCVYDNGIMLSKENAERLFEDAKMLFEAKRYSSSVYLAVQGIEEIGKALLFLRYKGEQKRIIKSQWEKVFKNHIKKLEELQKAMNKHCTKIRFSEGFGESKRYLPENKVQKMTVGALKLDKEKSKNKPRILEPKYAFNYKRSFLKTISNLYQNR